MGGKSSQENSLQCTSVNFDGNANEVSYGSGDDQNQRFAMSVDEKKPDALSLSQWIRRSKTPRSYVEFLTENSTCLENAPLADVLQSIALPLGAADAVDVPEIHRELLYNSLGKDFTSNPDDSSLHMDPWELKPFTSMLNSDCREAPVSFLKQPNEGGSLHTQFQTSAQTLGTQEPSEDNCNSSQFHPKSRATASASKPPYSVSRQRATATGRQRRLRIADKLKSLQELLPNPVEGSQVSVLDDVIGHIKFLQLQIKELSRSRLGDESSSRPFIFLEGYGHYILHEEMIDKPLEEMMGKLLEINPSAAAQLLESRGLYLIPMALAEEFSEAT